MHPSVSSKPVILIGMPSAGKSYWARRWAMVSARTAVDLDTEIEEQCGLPIPEIFAEKGEAGFREIESMVLERILHTSRNILLATGGGTPCFGNNLALMLAQGRVLYLQAPIELLMERMLKQPEARPLFAGLPENLLLERLEKMLAVREPFYRKAHLTLQVQCITEATFDLL